MRLTSDELRLLAFFIQTGSEEMKQCFPELPQADLKEVFESLEDKVRTIRTQRHDLAGTGLISDAVSRLVKAHIKKRNSKRLKEIRELKPQE